MHSSPMVKVINNETFGWVMKENMKDSGMKNPCAVPDIKEKFEMQDINSLISDV